MKAAAKSRTTVLVLLVVSSYSTLSAANGGDHMHANSFVDKERVEERDSHSQPTGGSHSSQFPGKQLESPSQQQQQQHTQQQHQQQQQAQHPQAVHIPQQQQESLHQGDIDDDFRSYKKASAQAQQQSEQPVNTHHQVRQEPQQQQHREPEEYEHIPPNGQPNLPLGHTHQEGSASLHGQAPPQTANEKWEGGSSEWPQPNTQGDESAQKSSADDQVDYQPEPAQHLPLGKVLSDEEKQQTQQKPIHKQHLPKPPDFQVTPPILDEEDDDDFFHDDDGEELEGGKREQTLEEIEAEKLFQAGEKLINATYYKEYKEAYLYFLQASQLKHAKAKEYVAFGHLFGDYLPQNVTRAAELFTELASKGSPRSQMGLAFMYSAGFHFNSSQAKALIFSTFGALGGDPQAQMALGYRYYAGIGVESKCETALTYYRKVATKVAETVSLAGGPVVQRIRLQEEAESQGTNNSPLLDDDLLQYYHFLADKGDQQAQVVLGTLYYQGGKGVQINHEQAYHYFSIAAQSGNGHALGYLGKMHSEGSPVVKQNNNTAFEFFKKSADKNNHIGQAGLGMMYLNGLGVDKDTNKAFRYFSLASDQGSVDGQLQLGIMYFSGNGVRKDYKMAVKYFTMASQNGHVLAFYNLAQMHATGTGVLRNCHTAVELFKNVAERGRWSEMLMEAHRMYNEGNIDTALVKYMFLAELGYEVAQSNVAYILDNGATSKFGQYETYQRALLQYSRAASQGSTHARLKMGDYHYYGLGTDIDYESAASHYRVASEQQHNAQAMFNLGYMHEKGLGLKQDVHLAKRFYDMAAETSMDAHVPVTMALLKLGLFYGVDVFSKEFEGVSGILEMLDPIALVGPEWDLYLASVLAGLFAAIFFMRRMR